MRYFHPSLRILSKLSLISLQSCVGDYAIYAINNNLAQFYSLIWRNVKRLANSYSVFIQDWPLNIILISASWQFKESKSCKKKIISEIIFRTDLNEIWPFAVRGTSSYSIYEGSSFFSYSANITIICDQHIQSVYCLLIFFSLIWYNLSLNSEAKLLNK